MTTDTKPMLVAVNMQANRDVVYIARALHYMGKYMHRIGVQDWSIVDWQSVVWYDGNIRVMPYRLEMNGKDRFVFDLAGGFRSCCEYMFSKLDEENILHKGIPI